MGEEKGEEEDEGRKDTIRQEVLLMKGGRGGKRREEEKSPIKSLEVLLMRIHVAIFPLFSSDLSATRIESFVPGTNLKEENPRYLLRG